MPRRLTRSQPTALPGALRGWRAALGGAAVVTDRAVLAEYETATFATGSRIVAVLKPKAVEQIPKLLRVAARSGIAIHPVSRGRNWGYGCRVPTTSGAAVLDLAKLDRIRDFDDSLGYVTVEPGVTFGQLADYLARRRSRRVAPAIGSSKEASVLANALERGIGFGRFGNRIETLCDLDVILSTGERIRTGFGRFPRAACGPLHRMGVGPSLEGLFSQSSLGVVVGATVWLERRPAYAAHISLTFRDGKLGKAVAVLRELLQLDMLKGVIKLSNRYSALMSGYVDAVRGNGAFEIPRPLALGRSDRYWGSMVTVWGDDAKELRARANYVHARLKDAVDQASKVWMENVASEYANEPLAPVYWRAEPPITPTDPRRDGRGAIFCCPAVPLDPAHITRVVRLLERTFLARSFEPYITVNLMNERVVNVVSAIFYDRRARGEDQRAMRAYRAAFGACVRSGYYPYRLGNQSMGELPASRDASDAVLDRIARALDPAGILSKNRYRPRASRPH
jgi:4-cresol dehydrogenase (hydroxylating)